MAMDRTAAQLIIDKAAEDVERILALFIDDRCPSENAIEASERLTRLKDEWEDSLKARGPWTGTPAEHTMRQAAAQLSDLRRNSRPMAKWCSILRYIHMTLKLHPA